MQVTVALPDEVVAGWGADAPQKLLEALLLQRYLTGEVSIGRLGELLNLSRSEAEDFLDRNNARLPYTREMLNEDRRQSVIRKLAGSLNGPSDLATNPE